MYAGGKGMPQDFSGAMKWFRMAADQGNVKAQNNLGFMNIIGQGVAQDYVEAGKWYRQAAGAGICSCTI